MTQSTITGTENIIGTTRQKLSIANKSNTQLKTDRKIPNK